MLTRGQSGSDVVLVGESAENLSAVDPVLGEVDCLWWLSLGLSWCELAEGAVRPGSVIVPQVFGRRPSQVVLMDERKAPGRRLRQSNRHPQVLIG